MLIFAEKQRLERKKENDQHEDDQIYTEKHRKIGRNKDGVYDIGGYTYKTLCGSRIDVYNRKAYRTSGNLTKSDLIVNKHGKLVSRSKSVDETRINRLEQVNARKKARKLGPICEVIQSPVVV